MEYILRENPFADIISIGKTKTIEKFYYIDLTNNLEKLYSNISKSHKRSIKKAESHNLIFEKLDNSKIDFFYKLYLYQMKKIGAVPHKLNFFNSILEHLEKNIEIYLTHKEGIIASSLTLATKENLFLLYSGMNEEGYKKCAKHFLIKKLILLAKERKFKRLILGTGMGSIAQFKKGFTKEEHYIYTKGGKI